MKCGIIGLPNVGKSTLFNSLSSTKVGSANFPFCTIEPNLGMIQVPDERLYKLEEMVLPEKLIPAMVEIIDIAGLVKGAHKGEGLGNKFLSHIGSANALIHMLRCFEEEDVIHVEGKVDPIADKEIVDLELQLKDLETIEKKQEKEKKNPKSKDLISVLEKLKSQLNSSKNLRELILDKEEEELIKDLNLLTLKPIIYLCNVDEKSLIYSNPHLEKVKEMALREKAQVLIVAAKIEAELAELENQEEKKFFLEDLGLESPGVDRLIKAVYDLLGLETYFTVGQKEVRAWTICKNSKAPVAASVIHSDFEKGFIRAEVIHYKDFIKYKSEAKAREAGKLSIEGKEYVVQDGDIIHFRFNV